MPSTQAIREPAGGVCLHEQSLRDLSRRTGLHESLLSRLLNRKRRPSLPALLRIAQTCGLTLDEAYRQLAANN